MRPTATEGESDQRDATVFRDRRDAGAQLAAELVKRSWTEPVVLALPRGGVPVAAPVAEALNAPLEVFVARKVGAPGHAEFGIGAVAEGSDRVLLGDQARAFRLTDDQLRRMADDEQVEIQRRISTYRGGRPLPDLTGRDVIVVDDGLATGVTAEASVRALLERETRSVVLAVPVCAREAVDRIRGLAEVVCLASPRDFRAVGLWYEDFGQTTDDEVVELLDAYHGEA